MPMTSTSRLAKMARIAAKIAAGIIAFVLLVVLALFIFNSFDARLSEQAKTLFAAPPNPYAAADNLYLAMAGLEGAGERSITDMGQERINAYNQTRDLMLPNPELSLALNKKWDSAKLPFNGKPEVGPQRTTSIWTDVKSHREEVAALIKGNQQLYQRYLSLHCLRGYYETAHPSYNAPLVSAPQPLRILFLADIANRVQTGDLQQQHQALAALQQDMQMWKTVLRGDGTLLGKMVAVASLHADLILVADLIADPETDLRSLDAVLEAMLVPFDPRDLRIGNAFAAEFRGTATLYNNITAGKELTGTTASSKWLKKPWNAFQAHFFKVNATENMSAAETAQWITLADSEPSQFLRNRNVARDWLKNNEPHLSPALLYNPIGKLLVRLAVSRNDGYPLRVYDMATYQRLVYLMFQLKRQHIMTPEVAAFLKGHPEWSTHPVDGKAFSWDTATGELAVNTLGEHPKDQRFSVVLR